MTDHRDPIEAWLSADVEPLLPRSGTFDLVRRRARRRKAVRTISVAAGAVVVVAAAATLPQVARGLLPGQSGGPARVGTHTAAPSTGKSGGTASHAPKTSASPGGHGPALSTAGGTGPTPAAGFRPTSVTFVGNGPGAVLGAALGLAGSCGTRPCTVMAGTRNYGGTWTEVGAPQAGPPDGSSGVSQVRFLDPANGWAYGPELYATHDGGVAWHRIAPLPGRVVDLAAVGGRAFAVIGTGCSGTGSRYTTGCSGFDLYSAAARGDQWRAVSGGAGAVAAESGGLQLTRDHGYLVTSGRLYAGPVSGGAWHRVPVASAAGPRCLTGHSGRGPWLLAPTARTLYLVCSSSPPAPSQRLALYVSRDDGRNWQVSGTAPAEATSLAVSPGGPLVLATKTGIYLSGDARTWQLATLTGPAPAGGFGFVGMTTSRNGVAMPANPEREIFVTSDGGKTWRQSVIP